MGTREVEQGEVGICRPEKVKVSKSGLVRSGIDIRHMENRQVRPL
jgi:hypothetical protein